jgi:hypothetical protein
MSRSGRQGSISPCLPALILALALLPSPYSLAETRSDVRLLPAYFTGDFGNSFDTDITYVPLIWSLRSERQSLRVIVPWLVVHTDEPIQIVGGDIVQVGSGGFTEASGPGDVVSIYEYYPMLGNPRASPGRPWIAAGFRIKAPTADEEKGLGTGELDYGPQLSIAQPLGTAWFLFGEAAYVVRGDPEGVDFRNTLWLSGGCQLRIGADSMLSVALDHRESAIENRPAAEDVTLGFDRRLSSRVTFRSAGYVGLSETAEDYGLSLGLSVLASP